MADVPQKSQITDEALKAAIEAHLQDIKDGKIPDAKPHHYDLTVGGVWAGIHSPSATPSLEETLADFWRAFDDGTLFKKPAIDKTTKTAGGDFGPATMAEPDTFTNDYGFRGGDAITLTRALKHG